VSIVEHRACQSLWKRAAASLLLRIAVLHVAATVGRSAVAEITCDAPISGSDVLQITHLIRRVTNKPIQFIMSFTEDKYVPGAVVTGKAWMETVETGERTYLYTRTDLVSVYMDFKDRSHIEVYIVRKIDGRWQIDEKEDWSLP
jgi:hypothetical protein